PDPLVNDMVAERFQRDDRPNRFIMAANPRPLPQAAPFDQGRRQKFFNVTGVTNLLETNEVMVRGVSGRRVAPTPECKATYHLANKPPRTPDVCDDCGTALIQREDDKEETVRRRLKIYHQNNADLLAHYRAQGLLREVNGAEDIEKIYASIVKQLTEAGASC